MWGLIGNGIPISGGAREKDDEGPKLAFVIKRYKGWRSGILM